ncbi:MAG: S-layer homology domain-containing protein [Lutisporaceae bacterium]
MKNIKRSIILLLVAAMILSSVSSAFADTNDIKFTDISNSWAKQYIINVYNKGLMGGFSETIFNPQGNVTNFQVLTTIARMTKAKDKYDLAALAEKYKGNLNNVPDYAKQEIAYSLEAGIITVQDLSALTQTTSASKQIACRYLAKALGSIYDPDKPIVFLGFTDAMYINRENKSYIKDLIDLEVIDGTGDVSGKFNPDSTLTREIFAKMLDITSDKYGVGQPTIPPVIINPTPPPVIETPNYTGTVEQVIIEYGVIVFQIKGTNNVISKKDFTVANDIKCTIDGVESANYWKIKNGDKASIYLNKDGKVSKLIVDSKIKKFTGTIESILITDKLELHIKLQNGEIKIYYMTDKTIIIKNKSTVKYDYLKAGDNVAIIVEDIYVTDINADSVIINDAGIIESIIYTKTAAPRITMFDYEGNKKEYFIRKDLDIQNILIAGKFSVVYDLRPGMHVKVDLESDEIVKLVTTKTETSDKFDGTIKYINSTLKIITITQYDSTQQKEIEKRILVGNAEITNLSLDKLTLTHLRVGDQITIFGSEDIDKISATLIILNN